MNRAEAIEKFVDETFYNKREIIDLIGWEGVELIVYNDGSYDTRSICSFGEYENEIAVTQDLSPHVYRDLYTEHGFWNEAKDEPRNNLSGIEIDCLYNWFIEDLKSKISEEF